MSGVAPIDGETRDDAVDVLDDLLQWQLTAERWERVEALVRSLDQALVEGDGDALRAATAELELAGPVRITRIGSKALIPVPEKTRDRANRLVHTLGGRPREPRPDGTTADVGGDGDTVRTGTR
ncbi:CATRA system-associated protein [Streptomyces sp. NPDC046881]|uniref:CATRA system-associated protein n=1 Tax=Streptomyces sp. NPDC046881 TaxID=3155374 RepID=UPI0033EBD54F